MKRAFLLFAMTIPFALVVDAAAAESMQRELKLHSKPVPDRAAAPARSARRDPFLEPWDARSGHHDCGAPAREARGVRLAELTLKGTVQAKNGSVALFQGGAFNRGFALREGAELCDGIVTKIHPASNTVVVRVPTQSAIKPFKDVVLRH